MRANLKNMSDLLKHQRRYIVPVFQRGYVWKQSGQWDLLWDDITAMTQKILDPDQVAMPHFTGAVVIEKNRNFKRSGKVLGYNIIDGQQRLITVQLILAALHKHAIEFGADSVAKRISDYIFNRTKDQNRLKVYPNARKNCADRELFEEILSLPLDQLKIARHRAFRSKGSYEMDSRIKHSTRNRDTKYEYRSYDSIGDVPNLLGAFGFYHHQIYKYITIQDATEKKCLNALLRTITQYINVVLVDIDKEDKAQLIFETVNSRGVPLLQTDLIKNEIFRRAGGERAEKLFNEYWAYFEDEFWEKPTKARIPKIRLDDYFQCFIESKTGKLIEIAHLFTEYKKFIRRNPYNGDVTAELADLVKHGKIYETLRHSKEHLLGFSIFTSFKPTEENNALIPFAAEIDVLGISTLDPLLLSLWGSKLKESEKIKCLQLLISFIVRRGICGLPDKDYNKRFIWIINEAIDKKKGRWTEAFLVNLMRTATATTTKYPNNTEIQKEFSSRDLGRNYQLFILSKIEEHSGSKQQWLKLYHGNTIEHVLPDSWEENWKINGYQPSTDEIDIARNVHGGDLSAGKKIHRQINQRDAALKTMGNLTILTPPENREARNKSFDKKRKIYSDDELKTDLTRGLLDYPMWDEKTIKQRGRELFKVVKKLWPDVH